MRSPKPHLLIGIGFLAGLAILLTVIYGAYQFGQTQVPLPIPTPTPIIELNCLSEKTNESMTLTQAQEIAQKSTCVEEGNLKGDYFCNQFTGTWWLDLEIEKPGCAPACVVDVVNQKAEINWRCTGLRP
jgi:hypothetical protein